MISDEDRHRQDDIELILDALLIDAGNLKAIADHNPSADAPYHGYQHLIATAIIAYRGGYAERLNHRGLCILVVAALWHDFDHTAGPGDDQVNIERAVAGYLAVAYPEDPAFMAAVVSAIRATQSPGGNPTTTLERVLCDADLMQCLEPDGARFMAGLAAETGVPVTPETTAEFYRNAKTHTAWGTARIRSSNF